MKPSVLSFLLSFLLLGFLFTSCEKSDPEPQREKSKRTVLVYLIGKNTIYNDLKTDYNEIKEGFSKLNNEEDFTLIVFISISKYYIVPQLIKLEKDKQGRVVEKILETYDEQMNSTDPDVMRDILIDAYSKYPSESYGLVMESHADGWLPYPSIKVRAFGDDNGKAINITDLAKILENVTNNIGTKLDYLLFDACFMQSIEVAYELRHSVKHLIGSPTEVPGPGGPYNVLLPSLFDLSTNCSKKILDSYFDYYAPKYVDDALKNSNDNWTGGIALSSIDIQYIEELTQITRQLLSYLQKENIYLKELPFYDLRRSGDYSSLRFYHDIYAFLESVNINDEDYKLLFNEWKSIYYQMVYYRHTPKIYSSHDRYNLFSVEGTHGLSFYIPRLGYEPMTEHYKTHQWYRAGGWSDLGW